MIKAIRTRVHSFYHNYMTACAFAQANDVEDALLLFSSGN